MSLRVDDFEEFHRAVHGYRPFAWQSRLLRSVVSARRWPRVLDLPTGSGKTTCIDIAVFALALDATAEPAERWHPRRIAMIVDRRIVVDQAASRGRKLLEALETAMDRDPKGPGAQVLRAVAEALRRLGGPEEAPLGVFTLRGGIPKDDGWCRTPDQALVLASTVDQLGSRLLMQGYGVSPGMRPVHAGLAGNDALILLDEAHLSQPFRQTLERLEALRSRPGTRSLPHRFQFALLSATPSNLAGEVFGLAEADLHDDPTLAIRLRSPKPARIDAVSGREALADCVVDHVKGMLDRHRVIAVMVNRVDTALAVHALLRVELGESVVLLTGRMRPLDRDDIVRPLLARIEAGTRRRDPEESPLVVVGTQCMEAGADFDFDALVTESASLDALRQRCGRVDRLGLYQDADGKGKAEVMIVHDKAKEAKGDPIYGESISATIDWLTERQIGKGKAKTVDFASLSLRNAPSALFAPHADAPILLPAYLDLWSQTAPEPAAVPEAGLFLHGPRSGPEDVQVVWRADLGAGFWESASTEAATAAVGAIRPSSLEALSLPFVAARRWLVGRTKDALQDVSDLEVKPAEDHDGATDSEIGKRVLRWSGESSELVHASEIRPGDTIVVPSTYGGIDLASRCFDPRASTVVPDLAERAALVGRGSAVLRLHPTVLAGLGIDLPVDDARLARRELPGRVEGRPVWMRAWAVALAGGRRAFPVSVGEAEEGWEVLVGTRVRRLRGNADVEEAGIAASTDTEESSFTGHPVYLSQHTRGVVALVRDFARRLGFDDRVVSDLCLAAWLHDIGKADGRFQRLLRGGSDIAYYRDGGAVLAKSGMPRGSVAERRRARRLSGYPSGTRHEVQSVAMIESMHRTLSPKANDWDLVLHLVASHHGHCRPFAPAADDVAPIEMTLSGHQSDQFGTIDIPPVTSANGLHRLDGPMAARFWMLVEKYGWLDLCWLETVLRLADHRASEAEEGGEGI